MHTFMRNRHFLVFLSLAFCVALSIGVPGALAGGEAEGKGLHTTILIYSGKVDPHFSIIESDEIQRLKELLSKATDNGKPDGEKRVIPSILGYKGIVIMNAGDVEDFPQYVAVYKGNMEVRDKESKFMTDKDRYVERYLLDLAVAKKVLDKAYLESIFEAD